MLKVVIIGASGYAGAELAALVQGHPHLELKGLYVSAGSQDANKSFSTLHPQFLGMVDQPVRPLDEAGLAEAVITSYSIHYTKLYDYLYPGWAPSQGYSPINAVLPFV